MADWRQFEREAPDLAKAVLDRFRATKHHVLATLRADGSPRVSGTEVEVVGGRLQFGSMLGARKAVDLRRDGRCALHANPGDGSMAGGDAKVGGIAVEDQPPGEFHQFRLDLREAVLTEVVGDHLLVRSWRPGEPVRRFTRR